MILSIGVEEFLHLFIVLKTKVTKDKGVIVSTIGTNNNIKEAVSVVRYIKSYLDFVCLISVTAFFFEGIRILSFSKNIW